MVNPNEVVSDDDFLSVTVAVSLPGKSRPVEIRFEAEQVSYEDDEVIQFCEKANSISSKIHNLYPVLVWEIARYYSEKILPKAAQFQSVFNVTLPREATPEKVGELINPLAIYIDLDKSQNTYGISFECRWDPEHGLGVKLDGDTIIDIGLSEISFL